MEREDLRDPDVSRLDRGYASQGELLEDLSAWLDLLLYCYYSRHQWLGPSSELKNMLGLVVTREEFEHNLTKAAQRGLYAQLTAEERDQAVTAALDERNRLMQKLPALRRWWVRWILGL